MPRHLHMQNGSPRAGLARLGFGEQQGRFN
jgi:hypothetical protein